MREEDITEDMPASRSGVIDDRMVSAVKKYMELLNARSAPSLEDFLQQYSDIAEQLRPSLEGLAMVHRADRKPIDNASPLDHEFTTKPIGDFQIVGELGRGGMGIVYEAVQLSLGRHVALKVLPFASGLDAGRLQRFRNEAYAAAALHHTNIVPVYAVGSDRGVHYYAMQLIEGHTLAELIENMRNANGKDNGRDEIRSNQSITQADDKTRTSDFRKAAALQSTVLSSSGERQRYYQFVVRMALEVALAIEYAHQYGVIHRDIKPANLLLDERGKIWVTDFGLAQIQHCESTLTRTGDPLGTLRYMSPEQAAGNRNLMDHRTDIYSLGVTLYELLTLEPAIRGEGYREMLNQVVDLEPSAPRSIEPNLPVELDTIIRKAIAKVPTERYATAKAFADDLERWLSDRPISAKPPSAWERLAKWRRRNSGLVAIAGGILLLASIGLLGSTLVIWKEQRTTRLALDREITQRELAEHSFQQARLAVDTFSQLSENELAYRPDLQDLRQSFLEVSLGFYRDFLEQRSNDQSLANELAKTSQRVEKMVEELRILDSISPMLILSYPSVQSDLGLPEEQAKRIEEAIDEFQTQRRSLANQYVGSFGSGNEEMSRLVRGFNSYMRGEVNEEQLTRLRQIARQIRLPFTFKSSEIVAALGLSREQREAINRIIEETRPNRGEARDHGKPPGRHADDDRHLYRRDLTNHGPDRPGPKEFDLARKPPMDEFDGHPKGPPPHDFEFRPDGPPPLDPDFRPNGPPPHDSDSRPNGPAPDGSREGSPKRMNWMFASSVTVNTVNRILEILTEPQREKWKELVGKPFQIKQTTSEP